MRLHIFQIITTLFWSCRTIGRNHFDFYALLIAKCRHQISILSRKMKIIQIYRPQKMTQKEK